MGRLLKTTGDRLLSRLVPGVAAGACVPGYGDKCCGCCYVGSTHYCFRINCVGNCVATSTTCC
jgi:hypothetical protein